MRRLFLNTNKDYSTANYLTSWNIITTLKSQVHLYGNYRKDFISLYCVIFPIGLNGFIKFLLYLYIYIYILCYVDIYNSGAWLIGQPTPVLGYEIQY